MEYIWNIWNIYGIYMEYIWNIFSKSDKLTFITIVGVWRVMTQNFPTAYDGSVS